MTIQPEIQLAEIRRLMERSSKFISLSGLSGISVGILALLGASFAFFYLNYDLRYFDPQLYFTDYFGVVPLKTIMVLLTDAFIVLITALFVAVFFTLRKAKRQNLQAWNTASRLMIISLAIPLLTGGIFCAILLYHGLFFLVAPATLLFYGLALINAGKYTFSEIRLLGITEIVLGLIGCFFAGYGLFIWGLGFGVAHITYGIIMYQKYDKEIAR